jgi:hypothetical protein
MARNNRLWGAERIRGELLKLGFHVCKRTIQKDMRPVRASGSRGQKWSAFLHTHAEQIWACDASPSDFPLLPLAFRLLHHRIEISQSDPRRRHKKSYRCLDRTTASGRAVLGMRKPGLRLSALVR